MYQTLCEINRKPEVWSVYTAKELWTEPYVASQMLSYHLNPEIHAASRSFSFIDQSVDWMVNTFQLDGNSSVIDLGCGPGLYTSRFAQRGIKHVTGVDFSGNSIRYARAVAKEKELSVQYVVQNYLEFQTEQTYDLIIMIMCDYCVLSPGQRAQLLKRFTSLLKPNGAIVFDVYTDVAFASKSETATYEFRQLNGFWSPHDYFGFVNTFLYPKELVSLDKYFIVESDKVKTIYNWLQHFTVEMLSNELQEEGLVVEKVYADVKGSEYEETAEEMAVVVRR